MLFLAKVALASNLIEGGIGGAIKIGMGWARGFDSGMGKSAGQAANEALEGTAKKVADDLGELTAQRRLLEMTGETPDAHYLGRHSPIMSNRELLDRAVKGVDPWTRQIRTNKRGQIVNLDSTRVTTYHDMLDSIVKAQRALFAQFPKGIGIPSRGFTITIDMLCEIGVGFGKNTGVFRDGLTRVRVLFDVYGRVISAYPLYR